MVVTLNSMQLRDGAMWDEKHSQKLIIDAIVVC